MTQTYTIYLTPYAISILNTPNFKKIPNNASTQYICRIYPDAHLVKTADTAPKSSHVFRPHKVIAHPGKPAVIAPTDIVPAQKAPKQKPQHSKYRNDVNMTALYEYFDNTPTPKEEWIADVVAELNRQDAIRADAKRAEQEALRQFVESVRTPQPEFKPVAKTDTLHICIVIVDLISIAHNLIKTISDEQIANARRADINANILDKFECQMRHLSQSRGMKKMHDTHKMRHR